MAASLNSALLMVTWYTLWTVDEHFEIILAVGAVIFAGNVARFLLCHFQGQFYPARPRLWLGPFQPDLAFDLVRLGFSVHFDRSPSWFCPRLDLDMLLINSGVCAAATTSFLPRPAPPRTSSSSSLSRFHRLLYFSRHAHEPHLHRRILTYCIFLLAQVRMQAREYSAALAYQRQILEDKERLQVATKVKIRVFGQYGATKYARLSMASSE